MNKYSPIKIKAEAGLVRTDYGKVEWIGTAAQWQHAEHTEQMLAEHDCGLPSMCSCEQYLEDKVEQDESKTKN